MPANALYDKQTGVRVSYTGAFAAALGKSLLIRASHQVESWRPRALPRQWAPRSREDGLMPDQALTLDAWPLRHRCFHAEGRAALAASIFPWPRLATFRAVTATA